MKLPNQSFGVIRGGSPTLKGVMPSQGSSPFSGYQDPSCVTPWADLDPRCNVGGKGGGGNGDGGGGSQTCSTICTVAYNAALAGCSAAPPPMEYHLRSRCRYGI